MLLYYRQEEENKEELEPPKTLEKDFEEKFKELKIKEEDEERKLISKKQLQLFM